VSDINPVGSIKEFMLYNSLGAYRVTYDVQNWQPTTKAASTYTTGVDQFTGAQVTSARWSSNLPLQGIFEPVLTKMESAGFDFSPYDANGDKKFDHLHIIHSGYPAELGAYPCTPPIEDMIWSQGSPSSPPGGYVTKSGIAVAGYTISSAWTFGICANTPTTMAVASHEYIHGFDVKDVYDTDSNEAVHGIGGLGAFDTVSKKCENEIKR
jgi:M6 family metalloprotease-like protein